MVLGAEVTLTCHRRRACVPEDNAPIPRVTYVMPGGITLEDFRQVMWEVWDRKLDEHTDEMRETNQRVASLEHDARQPRLTVEAGGPADKKTRERTEGAGKVVQAMHGDVISEKGSKTFRKA